MKRLVGAVLCLLALGAAGCSGEESIFEQGPRFPDDEGVVTDMTLERMELEGERRYAIAPKVESFKTRSHEPASLLGMKEKYVQVGLNDDEVEWIAVVGIVVDSESPRVLYTGVFDTVDRGTGRAVFADGTTLLIGDGVEVPEAGGQDVAATIDARSHAVVSLQAATIRTTPTP